MNERFFDLMFFIKYWARVHDFCSTSKFSNFALCMLGLSFLLSLKNEAGERIVPPVYELLKGGDPSQPHYQVESWRCGFNRNSISIILPEALEFSFPGLLKGFFEYISQIPFSTHVVSVLTGDLILREVFEQNPDALPEAYDCYKSHIAKVPSEALCVPCDIAVLHDPFKLNHNLIKRVKAETLTELTKMSKFATELCLKAMESTECLSSLICQLLRPDLFPKSDPKLSCLPSSTKSNVLGLKKEPIFQEGCCFKNIEELLLGIFETLLLFKITKMDKSCLDSSNTKKFVAEDMKDVNEDVIICAFLCDGVKDVWTGRKKIVKRLKGQGVLKAPALSFQDENVVTNTIPGSIVDIKFQCITTRNKEGGILMNFKNLANTNGGYGTLFSF